MVTRLVISLACRKWGIYPNGFLPSHSFSWQSVYIVNKKTSILLLINQDRSKHPSQFIYLYIFFFYLTAKLLIKVYDELKNRYAKPSISLIDFKTIDCFKLSKSNITKTNNFWLNVSNSLFWFNLIYYY